jgi:hypothetical protein
MGEELNAFLSDLSPCLFTVVMHSPDHVEDDNNAKYYIHIHFVDPIDPLYKSFIIPEDGISFSPRISPTRIAFPLPLGYWLLFLTDRDPVLVLSMQALLSAPRRTRGGSIAYLGLIDS